MDEVQNSVEEEVTPQEQESTVVEQEATETEPEVETSQEDQPQERNWREMRRKEKELIQANQIKDDVINRLLSQQGQPQQAPSEPEASYDPQDYPNWEQTDKRIQAESEKISEKTFRRLRAKEEQERYVERLTAKYSDFSEVVTPETIELLENKDPELAGTIADLKDNYKMGLQTYKFIKALNLAPNKQTKKRSNEVEKKLESGNHTVQSPQAYNKRPMAKAFEYASMSKEEKNKLYEETMRYAAS